MKKKEPSFVRTLEKWEVNVYLLGKLVNRVVLLQEAWASEEGNILEHQFMVNWIHNGTVVSGLTPIPYLGTPTELEMAVLEFVRQDQDTILKYATNIF